MGMPSTRRRNSKKKCGEAQERVWGCRQLADVIRRRAEMGMPSNRRRNSKKGTEKASGNVGN